LVALAEQCFFGHLASYGLSSVTYQTPPGTGVLPPGRNVIGQINGLTKANEIVIIAAHLDSRPWSGSRAYGADDDASGRSMALLTHSGHALFS
jgi:Zn-dependent M28 family amino/carboxypeptidase